LRDLEITVAKKATENRSARTKEPEREPLHAGGTPPPAPEISEAEVIVPKVFKSPKEIDLLVAELNKLRSRISTSKQIHVTWKEID
jgi:hypothetical protein